MMSDLPATLFAPLSALEWEAFRLSLRAALWGTGFALPFAFALALLMSRKNFFGKSLLDALIHLPLILPPVAVGYGLLVLFGNQGVVGRPLLAATGFSFAFSWQGAALAAAVMSLPLMVRAIRLALDGVDPSLLRAAKALGAGRWRILATILFPFALPGIVVGSVLGLARALGEFGATIAFVSNIPGETRTLPLALYTALQSPEGEWLAARLALISLAFGWGALYASNLLGDYLRTRHHRGMVKQGGSHGKAD